jgi:hypothetical protein
VGSVCAEPQPASFARTIAKTVAASSPVAVIARSGRAGHAALGYGATPHQIGVEIGPSFGAAFPRRLTRTLLTASTALQRAGRPTACTAR